MLTEVTPYHSLKGVWFESEELFVRVGPCYALYFFGDLQGE
jgi:hypothetical protein